MLSHGTYLISFGARVRLLEDEIPVWKKAWAILVRSLVPLKRQFDTGCGGAGSDGLVLPCPKSVG